MYFGDWGGLDMGGGGAAFLRIGQGTALTQHHFFFEM